MASALERAARALADAESDRMQGTFYPSGQKLFERMPGRYYELARAVLMAVRELPDEILNEHLHDNEYGYAMYYEGWQPAIDAILADGEGRHDHDA